MRPATETEKANTPYLLVDAATGEVLRELPNAPSVLMLARLADLSGTVLAEQERYFKGGKTTDQLRLCKAAEKELREYLSRIAPQISALRQN